MTTTAETQVRWFSDDDDAGVRDWFAIHEGHREELQRAVYAWRLTDPAFGPVVQVNPEANQQRHRSGYDVLRDCIGSGDFTAYEEYLRGLGAGYARAGVPWASWHGLSRAYSRFVSPRLVAAYASEPSRLDGALACMEVHVGKAVALIGEGYLITRDDALRDCERRLITSVDASRQKGDFLVAMTHELRTPLNAIIGFTELLHDGRVGPLSATQHQYLGHALSGGRHLLQLIGNVLDLSKVEAGRMEFSPEAADLLQVVGSVVTVMQARAEGNGVAIEVEIAPEVRAVTADVVRLKQILFNLLANAIKFSPPGGKVRVRAIAEGEAAYRIEIEDGGPGIAAGDVDQLFTDFQQLPAGVARGGTGLGLALSRRLVEAQGGAIGVRSIAGAGCTFHAVLLRQAFGRAPVPAPKFFPSPREGAQTVLVVASDAPTQSAMVRALVDAGFAVETVATGAQALDRCRSRHFDAMAVDLDPVDRSGIELRTAARTAPMVPLVEARRDREQTELAAAVRAAIATA